ncbi:DUF262 domain-containing protein [Burkholderia sp. LMG 32019]|uniref:DUF262 domain-containing protein n=1 Tax=Burkholderia sp. LMG 32019 TaxID=3158173 RepID=UPI003C2C9091
MTFAINRETNSITIATFWENFLLKKYNFDPEYQRLSVWSEEKQSFLIDTILRNYPIPPIFLHQHIDPSTGKTHYDVIDGKQRLTSIQRFINDEISVTTDSFDENNDKQSELIAGKFFRDLDDPALQNFKKNFWRYAIPIEYIDTTDKNLIKSIFDRLNRNGEPLEGQELRKAKYSGTALISLVDKCCDNLFWKPILSTLDVKRMEDKEFVSELIFLLIAKSPLDGSQKALDEQYADLSKELDIVSVEAEFDAVTALTKKLLSNDFYVGRKFGISHLYGIFSLAADIMWNEKDAAKATSELVKFYSKFFNSNLDASPYLEQYKMSVTYRTRTKGQRMKRLQALTGFIYGE